MKWDGQRIRDLRRKMGWSPADLARRLDCHHSSIFDWELNKTTPGQHHQEMLDRFEQECFDRSAALGDQARIENLLKDQGLEQISRHDLDDQKKE